MTSDDKLDLYNIIENKVEDHEHILVIYYDESTNEYLVGISGNTGTLVSVAIDNDSPAKNEIDNFILVTANELMNE